MHELKINFGPGYRVYFGVDKASQSRDIARAKEYWTDYNA